MGVTDTAGNALFEEVAVVYENLMILMSFVWMLLLVMFILSTAGKWFTFKKINRKGYEAIIPFHNTYEIIKVANLPGWNIFLLLIPLYGIYVNIKIHMKFAESIGKSKGFGVGLALAPFIFFLILGADKNKSFFRNPNERFINTINAADGINNNYVVDNFANVETFNNPQAAMNQAQQQAQPQVNIVQPQFVQPGFVQPSNNLLNNQMPAQSVSQNPQMTGQIQGQQSLRQQQNQFMNNSQAMPQMQNNSSNIFDMPNNQS